MPAHWKAIYWEFLVDESDEEIVFLSLDYKKKKTILKSAGERKTKKIKKVYTVPASDDEEIERHRKMIFNEFLTLNSKHYKNEKHENEVQKNHFYIFPIQKLIKNLISSI